jgi:serine/threonine-protein kinase RsbW
VTTAILHGDARVARLAEVRAFVRETARAGGVDEIVIADLVQAVDEWVTNVAVHGYRGEGGPLTVEIDRDAARIVVRVRDGAPAFDPADAPRFDPTVPLERRAPGGMGIHLIRDITQRFTHRLLTGGGNEVTMTMALDRTEETREHDR